MRRGHFEALSPRCPLCLAEKRADPPLVLATAERETEERVLEGVLHCSDSACGAEYPILDGVPILLPRVRPYLADHFLSAALRDDLSETAESILGDCAGPGGPFDRIRQQLSIYAFDHYGEFDPAETDGPVRPGATAAGLAAALPLLPAPPAGPAIDLGCATGRTAFDLAARTDDLVVGLDLGLPALRLGQRILAEGRVRYPRRRIGVVYDRREFDVRFAGAERVDFWAADVLAPPFAAGTFRFAAAMNLLDCVPSPVELLHVAARLLRPGGQAVFATPYDWSEAATRIEGWIGGHSQRGPHRGDAAALTKALLTPGAHPQSVPGLKFAGEIDSFPWQARLHDRSTVAYRTHLIAAIREE